MKIIKKESDYYILLNNLDADFKSLFILFFTIIVEHLEVDSIEDILLLSSIAFEDTYCLLYELKESYVIYNEMKLNYDLMRLKFSDNICENVMNYSYVMAWV